MLGLGYVYKIFVRGTFIRNEQSWGSSGRVITHVACGFFLSVVFAPICALLGLVILKNLYVFFMLLILMPNIVNYFIFKKIKNDPNFYPDYKTLTKEQISKDKLYSDLLAYPLVGINILLTTEVLIYYSKIS